MRETLLDKVMPQDASGIFEYTDVHGDISRLVLDCRAEVTFLDIE